MSTEIFAAPQGSGSETGDTAATAAALQPPSAAAVASIAGRQLLVGLRFLIAMTIILGIAYPLLVLGLGRVISSSHADGSLITVNGRTVGSSLIGQSFTGDKWFQGRPSAAGKGYDPTSSGGTNLSADSQVLVKSVQEAKAAAAKSDGVPESAVPPDAVTSSASGLDPDISEAYALIQVNRVAKARGLGVAKVHDLVESNVTAPALGFIGTSMVNVLALNIAVQNLSAG
jgi:K+-transporting ATPase ATPase C chain